MQGLSRNLGQPSRIMIDQELVRVIRGQFALDLRGIHGVPHWSRVEGQTLGDATVLTCWDADRLDLGRVGIRPHPHRLCTEAARDPVLLEWAYQRSVKWRDR